MYGKNHSIYGVWYSPWSQASTEGLGTYSFWMRVTTVFKVNQEIFHKSLDFWLFWQISRFFHQWGELSSRHSLWKGQVPPGGHNPCLFLSASCAWLFGAIGFPSHVISLCCLECGPNTGSLLENLLTQSLHFNKIPPMTLTMNFEKHCYKPQSVIPNQREHQDHLGSFLLVFLYLCLRP